MEVQKLAYLRPQVADAVAGPAHQTVQTQPREVSVAMLLKDKDHTFKAVITDYNHFVTMKERYLAFNDKKGRTDVPDATDFPSDVNEQRELVQELYAAMVDCGDLIDAQRQKRTRKRKADQITGDGEDEVTFTDSTHVRRVKEASNFEIELLSWGLLVSTYITSTQRVFFITAIN